MTAKHLLMEAWLKNKIDAEAFAQFCTLPPLPFFNAIRQDKQQLAQQREAFLTHGTVPTFSYPAVKMFDALGYISAVDDIVKHIPTNMPDVLQDWYKEKYLQRNRRAQLIHAIQQKDDASVTHLGLQLYGTPAQSAHTLAQEFETMLRHASAFYTHSKPVTADIFQSFIETLLSQYDMQGWKIEIVKTSSLRIKRSRNGKKKRILIPAHLQISKARAARLLTHEIEVHVLRTENALNTPIALLQNGLAGYLMTDEGLALHYQQKYHKTQPQHAPGFWDAWTCALTQKGTFTETFNTIANARTQLAAAMEKKDPEAIGRDAAWRLCVRAYRGITKPEQHGVGYVRDHIYRSGYLAVQDFLERHPNSLPYLFVGNVGLKHVEDLKQLELPSPTQPKLIAKQLVDEYFS